MNHDVREIVSLANAQESGPVGFTAAGQKSSTHMLKEGGWDPHYRIAY